MQEQGAANSKKCWDIVVNIAQHLLYALKIWRCLEDQRIPPAGKDLHSGKHLETYPYAKNWSGSVSSMGLVSQSMCSELRCNL